MCTRLYAGLGCSAFTVTAFWAGKDAMLAEPDLNKKLSCFDQLGAVCVADGTGVYNMQPIKTAFVLGRGFTRNITSCAKYSDNRGHYDACIAGGGEIDRVPAFAGSFLLTPAPEFQVERVNGSPSTVQGKIAQVGVCECTMISPVYFQACMFYHNRT